MNKDGRRHVRADLRRFSTYWRTVLSSSRELGRFGLLGGLLGIVCLLGLVQYRWINQLAQAHRQSAEASFARAFSRFETDFDIEITRAFRAFQVPMGPDYSARYREWLRHAPYPELIRGAYTLEPKGGAFAIEPVVSDEPPLRAGSWADALPEGPVPGIDPNLTVEGNPAFLVPAVVREGFPLPPSLPGPNRVEGHWLLLVMNGDYIDSTFLPRLVRTYFPINSEREYDIAVVDLSSRTEGRVVLSSDSASPDKEFMHSDAASSFFELRPDCFTPMVGGAVGPPSDASMSRDILADVLARTASGCRFSVANPEGSPGGRWKMLIRYKAGSLDRAVAAFRYRNLLVSGAVLLILILGICMLVASAERTRALAAMQTEFVLGVSHELRTPLTVIRVAADNLTKGLVDDSESGRKYGEIIRAKASELSGMIEETLTFARFRSMPIISQAALTVLSLQDVVVNALAKCEPALRAALIEVERHITSELLLVKVDAQLVERCVENLIQNAIKYAAAGHWVGIWLAKEKRSVAEFARISVEDRGPGISSVDFPHIFEPFYRGTAAESSQVPGVGLGLALVKRIIESHGGVAEVTNLATGGAIVSIFLPLHIRESERNGTA